MVEEVEKAEEKEEERKYQQLSSEAVFQAALYGFTKVT